MNSTLSSTESTNRWEAIIQSCVEELRLFSGSPGLRHLALGVPDLDAELWTLGQQWLQDHPFPHTNDGQRDVYLATQLYEKGGHTPLIGDFVRALANEQRDPNLAPHLIVTDLHGQHQAGIPSAILDRIVLTTQQVTVLAGPTLLARWQQLFSLLAILRPRRLFLFHHPDDPLPCLAAQDVIAPLRYLVHHADANPTLGLHLPDTRVIDLNPYAAALSRSQGLDPGLVIPTCPDPGPRPVGFLTRGHLVTATCGSEPKYLGATSCPYAQTVPVILKATGGWHVHIGPLNPSLLAEIRHRLDAAHVSHDRFIHVPWTPSLAQCLWDHQCDLYLSSYPIDGARANAEVAGAATPYLRRLNHPGDSRNPSDSFDHTGGLAWRTWDDLIPTVQAIADPQLLAIKSEQIRQSYERLHHPDRFRTSLQNILQGGAGHPDPQADMRELQIMRTLTHHSLVHARKTTAELSHLRNRIDFLQEQRSRTLDKLRSIEQKLKAMQRRPRPFEKWWYALKAKLRSN